MNIRFTLDQKTRANMFFILLNFAGGDADTEHPRETSLREVNYTNYKDHLEEIKQKVDLYLKLKNILDVNNKDYLEDYSDVLEIHGEEIADLFDEVPNDPQGDYGNKCYLDDIKIIAYDEKANKYSSYI